MGKDRFVNLGSGVIFDTSYIRIISFLKSRGPSYGGELVIGDYNHPIGTYKTGIYCLLRGYIIPTTDYQNQNNPMI